MKTATCGSAETAQTRGLRLREMVWGKEGVCVLSDFVLRSFPGSSDSKESACNVGDPGSIPGSGRFPGEGNGNPLQYSCLEVPWREEPGGLQSIGLQKVRHD